MNMKWAMLPGAAILLSGSLGCSGDDVKPGTPPAFEGSSLFDSDHLGFAVGASYHAVEIDNREREKKYEPKIEQVEVYVDGNKMDLPLRFSSSFAKGGWAQSAGFTVPPQARSVRAKVRVRYMKVLFETTVSYERDTKYGHKWHIEPWPRFRRVSG